MKKILFSCLILVMISTACKGQFRLGLGSQYAIEDLVIGPQIKLVYESDARWKIAGTYTYHIDRDYNYSLDLDGLFHLLTIADNVNVAALAGPAFQRRSNSSRLGLNLGGFVDFSLDKIGMYFEPKYIVRRDPTASFAVGIYF